MSNTTLYLEFVSENEKLRYLDLILKNKDEKLKHLNRIENHYRTKRDTPYSLTYCYDPKCDTDSKITTENICADLRYLTRAYKLKIYMATEEANKNTEDFIFSSGITLHEKIASNLKPSNEVIKTLINPPYGTHEFNSLAPRMYMKFHTEQNKKEFKDFIHLIFENEALAKVFESNLWFNDLNEYLKIKPHHLDTLVYKNHVFVIFNKAHVLKTYDERKLSFLQKIVPHQKFIVIKNEWKHHIHNNPIQIAQLDEEQSKFKTYVPSHHKMRELSEEHRFILNLVRTKRGDRLPFYLKTFENEIKATLEEKN